MWQKPHFLRIWSQLLKKSLIENFIFCAVSFLKKTSDMAASDIPTTVQWSQLGCFLFDFVSSRAFELD